MPSGDADRLLLKTVLSDHVWRIGRAQASLKPFEVVVQISMVGEDAIADTDDAADIVKSLPSLGREFFTVQGTYLLWDAETLVDDVQQALGQALRKSPDGDFLPLVLSVLDRDTRPATSGGQILTGVALDLRSDKYCTCWISGDDFRLDDASKAIAGRFSRAVRKTIRDYWNYVASLD